MTTLLEAAKKAEFALDGAYGNIDPERGFSYELEREILAARTALRAAIEAAENQGPCSKCKGLGIVPIGDGYSVDPCPKCTNPTPTIPEGWQLVPKEPTAEMCSYMNIGIHHTICERIYKAMLQVAPEPACNAS